MAAVTSGPTVALFGLPIANVSMSEAIERIAQYVESGSVHQIATANLDFARNARSSSMVHRVICDCSMVLPDGAPLLWASRLLKKPLKERVTGVDLIPELARLSAERGYRIFLLGSDPRIAVTAAKVLERQHPGAKIVGLYSPPVRPLAEMDDNDMLRRIEEVNPDLLLVAFGNPKQELWISRNLHRLRVPVTIGIGGSLDMIAGSLKRAPRFIQFLQLEWMFRMMQEPKRLFPRYARDLKALLWHLPMDLLASVLQPSGASDWPLSVTSEGKCRVLQIPETLTGKDCNAIIAEAYTAARLGETLIFDMILTSRIQADGLGCMIEARRIMLAAQLPIWIAGVSQPVERVLKAANLFEVFRIAVTPSDAIRLTTIGLQHPERRQRARVVSGAPLMEKEIARRGVA